MASPFSPSVLPVRGRDDDETDLPAVDIDLSGEIPTTTVRDGAAVTEMPDGSVEIDLTGKAAAPDFDDIDDDFGANLAEKMDESELNKLASELLEGIDRDEQGRQEHLTMLAEGFKLLGTLIETLTTTSITSSAPLEGMSTIRHPVLMDACVLFQATAVGELLPAAGPVKVRDDRPREPDSMKQADAIAKAASMMGHNGGPPLNAAVNPSPSPQAQNVPSPAVNPMSAGASAPGGGLPPPPAATGGHPPMAGAPNANPLAAMAAAGHAGAPPAAAGGAGPMPGAAPAAPPQGPAAPQAGQQAGPVPTAPNTAQPQGQPAPAAPSVPEDKEEERDAVADAMEKDLNHYLTKIDRGYVRDTTQMFFKVGFGGTMPKKVYHDPLKRRPLSRSINIEDFIVSKDVFDLEDADRITHRTRPNRALMRRMQLAGAYRDIDLGEPTLASESRNEIKETKEEITGIRKSSDPRDLDYEVFECYCLVDLDRFAPRKFKGKRVPLPFKVSIEKASQKVLEVRRNWRKSDEECQPKQWFVDYTYIRAFGFYGFGLLHLLGNTSKALTALWREFIDAGMFANFPGFLYVKGAGRQLTNQFRVAPGSGIALDSSVEDITKAVMPLPYKSPDAAFAQFVQHIEELAQKLGGTAMTPVAEGRADAPVGTTMALLEQTMKPVAAVLKGFHESQARELELLKERFREDPEAFWRFNKKPAMKWEKDLFLKALEDFELVPVSDPNNPTKLHRMAKGDAYRQMVMATPPGVFDPKKAILKFSDEMGMEGVEETLLPNAGQAGAPQQPQIDPAKLAAVAQQHAKAQMDQQTQQAKIAADLQKQQMQIQDKEHDRQNKIAVASVNQDTERLRLASTVAIHASDLNAAEDAAHIKLASDHASQAHQHMNDLEITDRQHAQGMQQAAQQAQTTMAQGGVAAQQQEEAAQADFGRQMQSDQAAHGRQMQADTAAFGRDQQAAAIDHARQRQDTDIAYQRQSQDAARAHDRAKDMATHNAKVNPKPAAGTAPKKPAKAKPKKASK